jgi:hypothetical protein
MPSIFAHQRNHEIDYSVGIDIVRRFIETGRTELMNIVECDEAFVAPV